MSLAMMLSPMLACTKARPVWAQASSSKVEGEHLQKASGAWIFVSASALAS